MPRVALASVSLLMAASSASGQPPPDPVPVAETGVVIRINRDDPAPALVTWLAENAKATKLTPEGYPTLPSMTGRQVAEKLCGQSVPEYWDAFSKKNNLSVPIAPEELLEGKGYDYKWPACFYYERGEFSHVLKDGELAGEVYLRETGSPGTLERYAQFFRKSGIPDLSKVSPGQVLRYGYRTRPVIVSSEGDQQVFIDHFNIKARYYSRAPYSAPSVSGGEVITPGDFVASGVVLSASSPKECEGRVGPPFALGRLEAAYFNAVDTRYDSVRIVVADNGFFGAQRVDSGIKIEFRDLFERKLFDVRLDPATNEQIIGPQLSLRAGQGVNPLNFDNGFPLNTVPTEISGHGTHVTGLALGGPARFGSRIFGDSEGPWLRAAVVAFSAGRREIEETPAAQFSQALGQLTFGNVPPNVVNMSLKFGRAAETPLRNLFLANPKTLFVAAAGNQGIDLDVSDAMVYPAALGGMPNVLVVAAEDGAGTLVEYSNRSVAVVDIAAPGCNIESTLDGLNPATLSGTSQAAPTVTFAAALLTRFFLPPESLKRRLVLSGDLITGINTRQVDRTILKEDVKGKMPLPVRSRSRLNIAKALYKDYDYLRYRDECGQIREVLGELSERTGPSCGKHTWSFQKVLAFKRSPVDGQAWCFWKGSLEPFAVDTLPQHEIKYFHVQRTIGADGAIQEKDYDVFNVRLDNVEEFLMSERMMLQYD